MADIFISYSSKDRAQAEQLTELLASAGLSVWIDRQGIGAATSWTNEIAEALDACKVFVLLLSTDSLASKNVLKELSLAAEADKHIIPVELEMVSIPTTFKYHLAGLQRTPIDDTPALLEALTRFGCASISEVSPKVKISLKQAEPTTIGVAVLPFEDLSPARDNEWFADGMMDELIGTLGALEKLHVAARSDVVYYKKNRPKPAEIARELNIRYIVEGSVQKSGPKIRLRVSLSDAKEHKQVWSEKYDGTFDDIFDFQDQTAIAIAEALRLVLTPQEEKQIEKRPTENVDAYELYLRGLSYYERHTRTDYEHALKLYAEALRYDPNFTVAHIESANVCYALFRRHSRDPQWLRDADTHLTTAELLEGKTAQILAMQSFVSVGRGNLDEALHLAEMAVATDPDYAPAFDALSIISYNKGNREQAIEARERYLALRPDDRNAIVSYVAVVYWFDKERAALLGRTYIPIFERHARLAPDDLNSRIQFATVLAIANERTRAQEEIDYVTANWQKADGIALFSAANLLVATGQSGHAIEILRKAINRGYRNIDTLRTIEGPIAELRGTPEFEAIVSELEATIQQEQHS